MTALKSYRSLKRWSGPTGTLDVFRSILCFALNLPQHLNKVLTAADSQHYEVPAVLISSGLATLQPFSLA